MNFLNAWGLEASDVTFSPEVLKTDTPAYFNQHSFEEVFDKKFGDNACAATSLLNELSEQYTKNTGYQMSQEQANKAMKAAVDSKAVRKENAHVDDWAAAANDMWKSTGQSGNYTYGGSEATAIIYAEDKNKDGEADHFTNSNGINSNGFPTYYDPDNGNTGIVGDTPLQKPTTKSKKGSTRELTYHP